MIQPAPQAALLALEDGSLFHGFSYGAAVRRCGEAVFNTAMTGYEEILTDPSYSGQLVCLTAAHVGNTGMTLEDAESTHNRCAGLIIRHGCTQASSWRARQELPDWLRQRGLPAIRGVDTRRLTRVLRRLGSLRACLACDGDVDVKRALFEARCSQPMTGRNLASTAGTPLALQWMAGSIAAGGLVSSRGRDRGHPEGHGIAGGGAGFRHQTPDAAAAGGPGLLGGGGAPFDTAGNAAGAAARRVCCCPTARATRRRVSRRSRRCAGC
jgi:hypothetical protein